MSASFDRLTAVRGTLVFSHGNSFPGGTYARLFEVWRAAGWRVEAVDRFGHDPRFPVTNNWPHLRDQLIDFIDSLGLTAAGAQTRPAASAPPLVLVGHSLGGFVSLLAALRRPGLADAVVQLDSPLVAGWRAHSLHMVKATRLISRVSPGKVSQRRRHHWPDLDAVRQHFASKHTFACWDPRVLEDYLQAGFEPDPAGGVRLRFDRQVETRIYNTLPHHLPAVLRRHPLRCPIGFVAGTQSQEIRQVGLSATRALVGQHLVWQDGTHLFPMEQPEQTALAVLTLIDRLP